MRLQSILIDDYFCLLNVNAIVLERNTYNFLFETYVQDCGEISLLMREMRRAQINAHHCRQWLRAAAPEK